MITLNQSMNEVALKTNQNYAERPLPISKNKKSIDLFKNQLGGKIMKEFVANRSKTYVYLMDDDSEEKIAKGTKKCVIEYSSLMITKIVNTNDKVILKSQQRFRSDCHNICTVLNKSIRLH